MKRLICLVGALLWCACALASGLTVMSFNMRYDNREDGQNRWRYRRDLVAEVVTSHQTDVFGAQEVLHNQLQDLKRRLPGYDVVGVGREDGRRRGEFSPIFFRKDRFTLLDAGTFWLSETPEVAGSKGWDGACERIATWVILRDAEGEEFLFINTHLDHRGEVARKQGVTLLLRRIEDLRDDRPVILTGDFNAEPESSVIDHVHQSGFMHDTKQSATTTSGPSWSFSDFGEIPEQRRPLIDYIFVSDGVAVSHYEVLPDTLHGGYVSDHAPVMARIKIEK